jgi:hypothetical protein
VIIIKRVEKALIIKTYPIGSFSLTSSRRTGERLGSVAAVVAPCGPVVDMSCCPGRGIGYTIVGDDSCCRWNISVIGDGCRGIPGIGGGGGRCIPDIGGCFANGCAGGCPNAVVDGGGGAPNIPGSCGNPVVDIACLQLIDVMMDAGNNEYE